MGGVWATSSLFAGGGNGAMAVAGGVEGTACGGSGEGMDRAVERSSAAKGAGANAIEVTCSSFDRENPTGAGSAHQGLSRRFPSGMRVVEFVPGSVSTFFGDNGRTAMGGVWATSSLFAGGGNGAMVVTGGVEGTACGGSGEGMDRALERSSAAKGAGAALEVTTLCFTAGVSIRVDRDSSYSAGRDTEGVRIGVVNRLAFHRVPRSTRGNFAIRENGAQATPDVRKRKVVIKKVRCTFVMRIIAFKFNNQV